MNFAYELRQEASKEFAEAYVWYEEQQEGIGERFIIWVESKLRQICKDPFLYKKSYKNFHETLTEKFPFLIVYFIDEKNELVIVTAIFHTSRHPKYKFKRTRLK